MLACVVIGITLRDASAGSSQAPAPDGNVQTALEELRQMVPQAIQELKTKVQPFMQTDRLSYADKAKITDAVKNGKQKVIQKIKELAATGGADMNDLIALGATISAQVNNVVQNIMTKVSSKLPADDVARLSKALDAAASELYTNAAAVVKKLLPKQKTWGPCGSSSDCTSPCGWGICDANEVNRQCVVKTDNCNKTVGAYPVASSTFGVCGCQCGTINAKGKQAVCFNDFALGK